MQTHGFHIVALLLAAVLLPGHVRANTPLTCFSCGGIECQRTSLSQTVECADALDYCVTIYEHSKVEFKGCALEIPASLRRRLATNALDIHKCNTARCNSVGALAYACLQCDSTEDANCAQAPTSIKATHCVAPTAPNSYCFMRTSSGGRVERGCATSVAEQEACYVDSNCSLCSPGDIRNCNNNVAAASSKKQQTSFKLK